MSNNLVIRSRARSFAGVAGGVLISLSLAGGFGLAPTPAHAGSSVACGGAAMMGGAQLMCSQTNPSSPAQMCNFSWALMTEDHASQVVQGSFLLPAQANNVQVYQGSGFAFALSQPIIMCESGKGH